MILRWIAAVTALMAGGFVFVARADIELPSVPPAQPEAVTAKVFVGESVDIPLTGLSRSGQALQFLIRRPPAAGSLSEVTLTDHNSAVVTYTHDAAAGPGVDHFRYAVKGAVGGVSTPAEVTINVVEHSPVFVAPAQLDFSSVVVGRSASQTFEIRNDGGGRLEGTLSVPPPWSLTGDARYALGPGESRSFVVTFAPGEVRRFSDVGTFSHADGAEIGLMGIGFAPVEVVPRQVRLEGDGQSEVRSGEFLVRNVSDEDHELTIAAPSEVVTPGSVKVAAHAETQVPVHTRDGFLGALDGMIKLSGQDVRVDVPLQVMPAPARVQVEPAAIDFGTLKAGKYGKAKLTLRNMGGSPAALRVSAPEGVQLRPDPSYEDLAPGQAREIEVSFARPSATTLDDSLSFDVAGVPTALHLKARVIDALATPVPDDAAPPDIAAMVNAIPPVSQLHMTQTHTSVDLTWRKTSLAAVRYVVFLRTMGVGTDGKIAFKYTILPHVQPRIVRNEVRASLHGLRPGESATLMIVAYDAAGKPSMPSPPFVVFSKPREPWKIPWTGLGVLAMAGFVAILVRERRRRRGVTTEDIERIYRG